MGPERHGLAAGDLAVDVAGERLVLMPERAAFWPSASTLLIADAHLGKAATFRAAGIAVPGGTTAEALARIDLLLRRTAARRLVFLGDLLHAREGNAPSTRDALDRWRRRHEDLEVILVRGNHDRRAGDPDPCLGIRCVDPPLHDPPFALRHHPDPAPASYTLAGHLHPAVRLAGRGRQRGRLPCFWVGTRVAVLPSFGDFTGAADVESGPGDRVFVIAEDQVIRVA